MPPLAEGMSDASILHNASGPVYFLSGMDSLLRVSGSFV